MPRPDVVGKTMKKLSVESCSKLIEPLHVDCASGFREKFSVGKFLTKAKKNFYLCARNFIAYNGSA